MRGLVVGVMVAMVSQLVIARAADESPLLHPRDVNAGRVIYDQYCASCHGARAQGVPNWQERDVHGELPAPPHDAEGHTWRHSDAELYKMVSKGWRDPFNKTNRLTMPGFSNVLLPEQIDAVIAYLKTLWTPEQREFQSEETKRHKASPAMR